MTSIFFSFYTDLELFEINTVFNLEVLTLIISQLSIREVDLIKIEEK